MLNFGRCTSPFYPVISALSETQVINYRRAIIVVHHAAKSRWIYLFVRVHCRVLKNTCC